MQQKVSASANVLMRQAPETTNEYLSEAIKESQPSGLIRRSTDADIRAIHSWLVEEEAKGVDGNFLCNWSVIERSHREGDLLVFVDGASQVPVAFQLGGLVQPSFLQVRQDMRGKGIGRKLVEHCVAEANKHGEYLLLIKCNPSASIPFWQAMGFTLFEEMNYAYRVLEKKHDLPVDGRTVHTVIRFYPAWRKWDEPAPPYTTTKPTAARASDGVVHLGERVFFVEELYFEAGDSIVEIEIDGQVRYFDYAKNEEAQRIGVRRCTNGFYIDDLRQL